MGALSFADAFLTVEKSNGEVIKQAKHGEREVKRIEPGERKFKARGGHWEGRRKGESTPRAAYFSFSLFPTFFPCFSPFLHWTEGAFAAKKMMETNFVFN